MNGLVTKRYKQTTPKRLLPRITIEIAGIAWVTIGSECVPTNDQVLNPVLVE